VLELSNYSNFIKTIKTSIMKYLLLICLSISVSAYSQSIEDKLNKAIELQEQFNEDEALAAFYEVLRIDPNNIEALSRGSYMNALIGNRLNKKEDQSVAFEKGVEMARKAVSINAKNTMAHFSLAVALGRQSLIADSEERLKNAKEIKKEAEIIIKLDPNHAGAHHILGKLNSEIADLSWYKVAAAQMLYGGVPENCSYEKAEELINKAISLKDDYILYYLDAAINYERMDEEAKAIALLEKAKNLKPQTQDDPQRLIQINELLKELND
jgi:tetratricopeptide (TPR) repeat protein